METKHLKHLKPRWNLRTESDLSRHLNIPKHKLVELANMLYTPGGEEKLYSEELIPKNNSNGIRRISKPRHRLKLVQKSINNKLLQTLKIDPTAIGGIKGNTLLHNVLPHVGKDMVSTYDLADCFSNITHQHAYNFFVSAGCTPDVARILTRLTTYRGSLPQGAPTSPMLAVAILSYGDNSLNSRLSNLARRHNANITTWIDDITISGPAYIESLSPTVRRIVEQSGHKLNQKQKFQKKQEKQKVTGIIVNYKPNIDRREIRRIRAILENLKIYGTREVDGKPVDKVKDYMRGKISHINMFNPAQGEKLLKQYQMINW